MTTQQQAIERQAQIIEAYPTARISKQTYLHDSESEDGREYILKQIVSPVALLQA